LKVFFRHEQTNPVLGLCGELSDQFLIINCSFHNELQVWPEKTRILAGPNVFAFRFGSLGYQIGLIQEAILKEYRPWGGHNRLLLTRKKACMPAKSGYKSKSYPG
jgi:hypothetical protein